MRYLAALFFILNLSIIHAQKIRDHQIERFDFHKVDAHLKIDPTQKKVEGSVVYSLEVLYPDDSLFINGKNMQFRNVRIDGKNPEFSVDVEGIYILHDFKVDDRITLSLDYEVTPGKAVYFINWDESVASEEIKQVWTQGQGKYTSSWLPSVDDMNEKAEFDLSFEFPAGYELIANGEQIGNEIINDSVRLWKFNMEKPMSSYLVGFAAGKYRSVNSTTNTGVEIRNYYLPEDSLRVEPSFRHSKRIMEFLEKEIGVDYPWRNYKQIPVKDFLYAGMENTGTTIFSESLMVDSIGYHDQNYVNVNAHELAHQWFGNLVTEKSGKHHWLHEGFATYYALLAEKDIFGEDYFYWKLYQSAEVLKELSDSGKGQKLLSSTGSSSTYYQKGAWALHILRQKVGEEAFRKGLKNYLETYAFQNVETDNFLAEMELASGMDLTQYKADWLEQSAFKANQSLNALKESEFIKSYLELAALRETPLQTKHEYLDKILDFPVNDYLGQEVVYQLAGENSEEAINLYKKAFASNNLYVRQAVATSMQTILPQLQASFESLLQDESYLTVEKALFKLWERFPKKKADYLKKTRNIDGFYNKNVRMLWLTLSLVSAEFEPEKTSEYFEELSGYTNPSNPFEVRENAFGYLYQLGAFNEASLESLLMATAHHAYRFRDFARQLLDELIANEEYREKLMSLASNLDEQYTRYLNSKTSS
ncbi:M1 family metallopeptidase [Christiangramia portivictoriae]|uniref:M1 family metallopeptidase n=1 Tax=Christiangramia portivictoriae TaxID=326069 RepID=UPI00041D74C0|nr:M1 family metallopeptidase [Christiangramia portivictoriae]